MDGWTEHWEDSFAEFQPRVDLSHHLHAKQLAFRHDSSLFRALIGTRRSGKTEVAVIDAVELADQFPGTQVPYVFPTMGMGRDIVYPKVDELNEKFGIDLHVNRSEFKIMTPSGGCVQLFGLATKPDAEKGRGKKYPGVYFGEAGAMNQDLLKLAATQTFGPATGDFMGLGGRGKTFDGTPGYEPDCYWEQICGGNTHQSKMGAAVHFMTIHDNPYFKGREEMVIEEHLRSNNMTRSDPAFRREWLGEFCADTEGLCYSRWNGQLMPRHLIPRGGYTVMGLDLGRHHPCAWVIVRFVITESVVGNKLLSIHHGHVIGSFEKSECGLEEIASITRKLSHAYQVGHIAGDSAGLGATIVADLAEVYALPIVPIKKTGSKAGRIWMADSMLGAGTLHVHEGCDTLIRQLRAVPWNEKRTDHHPRWGDHSCDALHGALTLSRQHEVEHELPPEPGSPEWYKLQEERDERAVMEFVRQRKLGQVA